MRCRQVVAALAGLWCATLCGAAADIPEPRLGLFVDKADLARGRARAETLPWARDYRDGVVRQADAWVARSDDQIRDLLPKPGERFAYGTAGCPKCSKSWKSFGRDVASFDRPHVLVCPHCKTEFDVTRTDGPYADTGNGVLVNGQRHWLRATWNGFVADSLWSAFTPDASAVVTLSEAYALTGDERYAKKLIVIMDALATLAPTTNGPRDFDPDPAKDMGRLQHLTSIMYRAQVTFARALDIVGCRPELQQPSATHPGVTVWENVRRGIFEEYLFKEFDNRDGKLFTLHNHEADSVRSVLLVGLLYGIPDYVRWGAADMRAFYDNTIDRDGLYYETSLSYTDFTRSVFVDMAEMLARYDPAKYPTDAKMPPRDQLPFGGNYFNHPKLARLVLDQPTRVSILGRQPTYGNNHFDTHAWRRDGRAFNRAEFQQALRYTLYATDPEIRQKAERLVAALAPSSGQKPLGGWWQLYRAPDLSRDAAPSPLAVSPTTAPAAPGAIPENLSSDLLGQTGVTFLRSGQGRSRRGAVMRVGPNLPHAHDDEAGLLLFANGRALSGDLGYGIFGNHVHLGFANRAIAHNLVVVNQDATGANRLFRMGPGGTITRFHDAPDAGVKWTEIELSKVFPASDGIKEYRRLLVQVDLGPDASYWIDLFDVDGGRTHDYSFHARPLGDNGSFSVTGASPKPIDNVWTLAGLDPKYRDASFDHPGRAWGERLTVNGMIRTVPGIPADVPETRGWYAPPGNGYGFLYDVRAADTSSPWSATWKWEDKGERFGLRLTMIPDASQQLIAATGPTLLGNDTMRWVVARSQTGHTRYTGVIEAYGSEPQVRGVEPLREGGRVVGGKVEAKGGRQDVFVDARKGSVTLPDCSLDSGLALIRRQNGKLSSLTLTGGTSLSAAGFNVQLDTPRLTSEVVSVDESANSFRTEPAFPSSVTGTLVTIDNPAYAHGSAYRVASVSPSGDVRPLNAELTLGHAAVASVTPGGFVSTSPLVYGYEYDSDTRFLAGKRITTPTKSGHISALTDFKTVSAPDFPATPGEEFTVHDLRLGDAATVESTVTLAAAESGEWLIQANVPAAITFPFPVEIWNNNAWSKPSDSHVRTTGGVTRVRPSAN